MNNPIWLSETIQAFASALHQFPMLLSVTDAVLKSIVILTTFALLDFFLGSRLNNTSRHLLWLNALLCLAILPWLPAFFALVSSVSAGSQSGALSALFELTVSSRQAQSARVFSPGQVAFVVYSIAVLLMLSRLIVSLLHSQRIFNRARRIADPETTHLLVNLKQTLSISRPVALRMSKNIESPVSFGLLTPVIILPAQARDWNTSIMTDVLLHELCHIKRLDWLTTLLAYTVACVYWANPLAWYALKRLREESEHSCDAAVLNAGRSDTDYAESLLGVARHCIHARRTKRNSDPLMQTMLDQNTLITRISRVLEEEKMQASEIKKQLRKSVALYLLLSAAMLGMLGATQVLTAQEQRPAPETRAVNEEMLPLHTEEAVYPKAAADEEIEGWVHLRFTVNATGTIDENSLSVVDAEPAEVFNTSALEAAKKFRFSPRVADGEPVAVPNVQYVFRYQLAEESQD